MPGARVAAAVLVVDPDEACRAAISYALTRAGVHVVEAEDIWTARSELGTRTSVPPPFDAIVIDAALAEELNARGVAVVLMSDEMPEKGPYAPILKPPRSVEVLSAIASAGGFGARSRVLVEDDGNRDADAQARWVARLARHGAIVATARAGAAFTHAATLIRPRVAIVGRDSGEHTFDLCRALGASMVVVNEEVTP